MVTPFAMDKVDYGSLRKLLDFHLRNGTKAAIVCGTTGEAPTLTDAEHMDVVAFAVKHINGRMPVIAGTGSNSTDHAIMMSKSAAKAGADGVLLVTPYYNKPTQNGIAASYLKIADSIDLPIIVYNVPSRTGVNILPETYLKLSGHDNIVAVKESNGNIASAAEWRALTGGNLDIYAGNDSEIVPVLSLGGAGVISVMANILPKETSDICELYFSGKIKESLDLYLSLMDLCGALFAESNPIPVKYAMERMGLCTGELRLPLAPLDEKYHGRLEAAMKKAGCI